MTQLSTSADPEKGCSMVNAFQWLRFKTLWLVSVCDWFMLELAIHLLQSNWVVPWILSIEHWITWQWYILKNGRSSSLFVYQLTLFDRVLKYIIRQGAHPTHTRLFWVSFTIYVGTFSPVSHLKPTFLGCPPAPHNWIGLNLQGFLFISVRLYSEPGWSSISGL